MQEILIRETENDCEQDNVRVHLSLFMLGIKFTIVACLPGHLERNIE